MSKNVSSFAQIDLPADNTSRHAGIKGQIVTPGKDAHTDYLRSDNDAKSVFSVSFGLIQRLIGFLHDGIKRIVRAYGTDPD